MEEADVQMINMDIGSRNIKAGFCGDDAPKTVFPNVIGASSSKHVMPGTAGKNRYVGSEAQEKRGILSLKYPIQRGEVTDWDDFSEILRYTTYDELRIRQPLGYVFPEPSLGSKIYREKLAQICFEEFESQYFYICPVGALSIHASGRTTGIVLDIGEGLAQVFTMTEGLVVRSGCARINNLAGADLNEYLLKLMSLYGNEYKMINHENRDLAREIKEKMCFVASSSDEFTRLNQQAKEQDICKEYTLLDGSSVSLSSEQWLCAEALFNPKTYLERDVPGVHQLVVNAIESCAIDTRKWLYSNIILSGGTTLLPNFPQRLQSEIEKLSSHAKVKVVASPERFLLPWLGGSVVGSMGQNRYFMEKSSYDEYGPSAVHPTVYATII